MTAPGIMERPPEGTVIRGMERVRISCRKMIPGSERIGRTGEHHAFSYVARENVIIRVGRTYYKGDKTP